MSEQSIVPAHFVDGPDEQRWIFDSWLWRRPGMPVAMMSSGPTYEQSPRQRPTLGCRSDGTWYFRAEVEIPNVYRVWGDLRITAGSFTLGQFHFDLQRSDAASLSGGGTNTGLRDRWGAHFAWALDLLNFNHEN
jgi:hypothetical protein